MMSKIDNLKAVAKDYDIPVTALIDFSTGYVGDEKSPVTRETSDVLKKRIAESERLSLSPEYINGLKDALKLVNAS